MSRSCASESFLPTCSCATVASGPGRRPKPSVRQVDKLWKSREELVAGRPSDQPQSTPIELDIQHGCSEPGIFPLHSVPCRLPASTSRRGLTAYDSACSKTLSPSYQRKWRPKQSVFRLQEPQCNDLIFVGLTELASQPLDQFKLHDCWSQPVTLLGQQWRYPPSRRTCRSGASAAVSAIPNPGRISPTRNVRQLFPFGNRHQQDSRSPGCEREYPARLPSCCTRTALEIEIRNDADNVAVPSIFLRFDDPGEPRKNGVAEPMRVVNRRSNPTIPQLLPFAPSASASPSEFPVRRYVRARPTPHRRDGWMRRTGTAVSPGTGSRRNPARAA